MIRVTLPSDPFRYFERTCVACFFACSGMENCWGMPLASKIPRRIAWSLLRLYRPLFWVLLCAFLVFFRGVLLGHKASLFGNAFMVCVFLLEISFRMHFRMCMERCTLYSSQSDRAVGLCSRYTFGSTSHCLEALSRYFHLHGVNFLVQLLLFWRSFRNIHSVALG